MDRRLVAPGVAVVIAAVVGGVVIARPPEQRTTVNRASAPVTAEPAAVTVHVSGSVVQPGLVTLVDDARVADAIAAAGGATPDADLGGLNLAESISDGTRLHVPRIGDPIPQSSPGTHAEGLISINRATVGQLQELPGVGPVLAQRIVEHRESSGGFTTIEDLLEVPGIGERILAGLRDLVLVR